MKIEIISMQRVLNHGSFLQAYGLKRLLGGENDVRFGDIEKGISNEDFCRRFSEGKKPPRKNRIKIKVMERLQKYILRKKQKSVLKVDRHFEPQEERDMVIIGSDEMFNCMEKSSWGVSGQLFGDVKNCKNVSTYAVSCGHTKFHELPKEIEEYISRAMKNLNNISVRDDNTAFFTEKIAKRTASLNLDPVLIYGFEREIKIPKIKKRYLLVYSYTCRIHDEREIEAIRAYAKEHSLITVGAGAFQYWCDRNILTEPFELLGYFKNARCIVTDTFHGGVISIKYNKPFAAFVRDSNRNKLTDLLERLEQKERIVNAPHELKTILETEIDYTNTNRIINKERERARNYLNACFEGSKYDEA